MARGIGVALFGVAVCAVFAVSWWSAVALAEVEATAGYVGRATRAVTESAFAGLVIGVASGAVLCVIGLVAVARTAMLAAAGKRATVDPKAKRTPRGFHGSATSHLLHGPYAARGILAPRVARAVALLLPWVLILALTLSTEPGVMIVAPLVAFLGAILGHGLYAVRPGARWARVLVVAGIPVLLALPWIPGSLRPGLWTLPLAFLVGAEIGAHLGELRERTTGPSPRVIAVEFAGFRHVGREGGIRFDIRAFLSEPERSDLQAFTRDNPELAHTADATRVRLISIVAAVFPIGLLAMVYGMVKEVIEHDSESVGQLLGMSAMFALMTLAGIVLSWWSARARARLTRQQDHFVFTRFAEQNQLEYRPSPRVSPDGVDTLTRTMTATDSTRGLILANRESAESSALGTARTYFGGTCVLEVGRPLPNIFLRSRRHRTPAFSSFVAPARGQQLSLEGAFDRYFELSVPKGYERDALYLFTPDVMAWLIDDVHDFDVELRDRQVFLRSPRDLVTRNPVDWQRAADALSGISARIAQWERWREERLPDAEPLADAERLPDAAPLPMAEPGSRLELTTHGVGRGVGSGGRRLRLGIGAGAITAVLFVVGFVTLVALANQL